MRGLLLKISINCLVVSLATPATLAFAGDRHSESGPSKGSPAAATAPTPAPAMVEAPALITPASHPAELASAKAMRKAIEQATAQTATPGRVGTSRPATRGVRAQYGGGGGGKGAMVMMLVSTVIGLAATVYMVRYMTEQQKKASEPE